jgi:hypothetical protein
MPNGAIMMKSVFFASVSLYQDKEMMWSLRQSLNKQPTLNTQYPISKKRRKQQG